MTMRERIARALWEKQRAALAFDHLEWDTQLPGGQQPWLEMADAVLAAMREQTKAMLNSGITAAENVEDWTQDSFERYRVDSASDMPRPVWLAMIDSAKEER